MRLFLDHCIGEAVAEQHTVIRLRNVLPTNSPDDVVLAKAQETVW